MELILELPDGLAVICHLRVDTVAFFHHLIGNELGVPSNLEASNTYFEGDFEPVEESLVLRDIVGYWEVEPDHVSHTHALRRDENEPGSSPPPL
jgi:hypothetical protein